MSKIVALDRENLRKLETDILNSLNQLSEAHGIKFRFIGGSFTPIQATLKLQVFCTGENGDQTPEREYYKKMCHLYGLKLEDLDKTVHVDGHSYKICGLRRGRTRRAVLLKREDTGRTFRFEPESVLRALALTRN